MSAEEAKKADETNQEEQQDDEHIKELEAKVSDAKKAADAMTGGLTTFEQDTKAAYALAEKYLQPKKGGMPDDTVKKVDDLKKSVSSFDTATKAMIAVSKDIASKLNAQKALLESELENAKMGDDEETPAGMKKKIDAMKVEITRLVEEKDETERMLHEQMTQIQEECNAEKEELVKKYTETVDGLQAQVDDLTDQKEILTQKLTVEQEAVASLKATLTERDEKIAHLTERNDSLEAEATIATQSAKDYKAERDVLAAQLKVAETCRANEFKAFERAIQSHEDETIGWEKKLAEAHRAVETMRAEKEAMRARLVDDHLREHIRVLQEENNNLREERIRDNHQRASEKAKDSDFSAVLAGQLREINQERTYFEQKIDVLTRELSAKEKALFDVSMTLETERSASQGKLEALQRQIQRLQLAPDQLEKEIAEAKAIANKPPVTRAVSTQASDSDRKNWENELIVLRAHYAELQDRLEVTERSAQEQRRELENKLLAEAEDYTSQTNMLTNQLKAAKYKISKLQRELSESSERGESPSAASIIMMDERANERKQRLEKQAVEASLEAEGLRVRVRTLQRELLEQREYFERRIEELQYGSDGDRAPPLEVHSNGNQSPQPQQASQSSNSQGRSSSLPAAERRAAKQADIDEQLLQLHEVSIKLDEKERNVEARREASEKQIKDRQKWVEDALYFWRRPPGNTQRGPEGESPEDMIKKLSVERKQLEEQLKQVEEGMLRFYKEIGERRQKVFAQSTELLKERAEL